MVVRSGDQADKRIHCRRIVTFVGSRSGCKVSLQHPGVSSVHLAVVNCGVQVVAVDLLSKRGTKLNGLKMEHEVLNDGDVLTVDPWELLVEMQRPSHRGHDDVLPFELEPTPQVVALEHLGTGRILQPHRDVCLVGRRSGCDIHIDDKSVSRAHALLIRYFGYPAIVDLLSRNKTFVNDEPVTYRELKDKDVVKIGESQFCVRLVGSAASQQASKNSRPVESSVTAAPETPGGDLIDIETVEGSQRWNIADKLEQSTDSR